MEFLKDLSDKELEMLIKVLFEGNTYREGSNAYFEYRCLKQDIATENKRAIKAYLSYLIKQEQKQNFKKQDIEV